MKKPGDHPTHTVETTSLSAIEHVLAHRPEMVRSLRLAAQSSTRLNALESQARKHRIHPSREHGLPEGAIALLAPIPLMELEALVAKTAGAKLTLLVALDHIQDPQNLGAICRTAEALGVAGLLLPKHRCAPISGAVFSASAGAVATLPIAQTSNLGEGLRRLKEAGYWIIGSGLGPNTTPLSKMPDFEKMVLVLGAEGEGMAALTEKLCDWSIQIPLSGFVQSLNVSAAGAILIYALMERCKRQSG